MLPAITPPTDNLYKFICLFGLTIFLFFSYNLSIVHGRSAQCHMKVENVKVKAQYELSRLKKDHQIDLHDKDVSLWKKIFEIPQVKYEIARMEQILKKANLEDRVFYQLDGELNKVDIEIGALQTKLWTYIAALALGITMIIWGFIRWQRRDQNYRDTILKLEQEIKIMQREKEKREAFDR